ncbi:MAG: OsmC family peroxiredoxin [Flavobacteriales bacterium]|nr:OsmC family peroxiredoxin [Flavobacteriales bacterium]
MQITNQFHKMDRHNYFVNLTWLGNKGVGTESYSSYGRDFSYEVSGKQKIIASADTIFRGNGDLYNPEEMFLVSISSCHMLWYLHLCADNAIVVEKYEDIPKGNLILGKGINGYFDNVKLSPKIWIKDVNKKALAVSLHTKAHEKCFIANSVKSPIEVYPTILTK